MLTAVFVVSTVICAVGWFTRYISCTAMIYYIEKNGYKQPNSEEMEECTRTVVKHMMKSLRR